MLCPGLKTIQNKLLCLWHCKQLAVSRRTHQVSVSTNEDAHGEKVGRMLSSPKSCHWWCVWMMKRFTHTHTHSVLGHISITHTYTQTCFNTRKGALRKSGRKEKKKKTKGSVFDVRLVFPQGLRPWETAGVSVCKSEPLHPPSDSGERVHFVRYRRTTAQMLRSDRKGAGCIFINLQIYSGCALLPGPLLCGEECQQ